MTTTIKEIRTLSNAADMFEFLSPTNIALTDKIRELDSQLLNRIMPILQRHEEGLIATFEMINLIYEEAHKEI